MKNIYIIGAGGHAKVIVDIILKRMKILKENIQIKGFLDDNYKSKKKEKIFGISIVGDLKKIEELKKNNDNYFIIAIGDNKIRKRIFEENKTINYYTAIHPNAILGENVEIKEGTVIMAGVIINSYTKIGKQCIINTGAIIEHDNNIGDFVHISPKVALAGNVSVGELSWIGIGSNVIQSIKIGTDTLIGAGSVVVKKIGSNIKAYGNPCKEMEKL